MTLKKINFILIIVIFIGILFNANIIFSEEKKSNIDIKKETLHQNSGIESKEVDDILPKRTREVSMFNTIMLDILLPGGGHFYREDYFYGTGFLLLKIAGGFSIFYYYKEWEYAKSLYYSAKNANKALDPDHVLYFDDPRGSYKTVNELERDYDSAVQYITFAVLANVVIYATSLIINYYSVNEMNEKAIPTFEFSYSIDDNADIDKRFIFKYTFRI